MSAPSIINIRPQHPAVHEVLRLIINTEREFINYVNPEIRYLHKGTEKLCKKLKYYKITPSFDKFNYVGLLICEHTYVLSVKTLLEELHNSNKTSVNNSRIYTRYLKTQILKIIYNNLALISSHLLALTTSSMNIRAITPFLFAFEDREEIATIFKRISGAKMHTAFYSINSINFLFTIKDLDMIKNFLFKFSSSVVKIYEILQGSKI